MINNEQVVQIVNQIKEICQNSDILEVKLEWKDMGWGNFYDPKPFITVIKKSNYEETKRHNKKA